MGLGTFVFIRREGTLPAGVYMYRPSDGLGELSLGEQFPWGRWDPDRYRKSPTAVIEEVLAARFAANSTQVPPKSGDVVRVPTGDFWLILPTGLTQVHGADVTAALVSAPLATAVA